MSFTVRPRSAGSLLFALIVGLTSLAQQAVAQNFPPKLKNVTVTTPIPEYSATTLIGSIQDRNPGDAFKLIVNWGDGNIQSYTYPAGTRGFTNYHFYYDDGPTNTASDIYRISVKLSDLKGGAAKTNLSVTVTNLLGVAINLSSANIVQNAAATERGLEYTEFKIPTPGAYPYAITRGPDGNIWFTEGANKIARITQEGVVTEFPVTGASGFAGICTGPDGRLWFTCANSDKIGRITTNGAVRLFDIPHPTGPFRVPWGITAAPDQKSLWFVGFGYRLSRINTNGVITTEYLHDPGHNFHSVVVGPDNALWYTDWGQDLIHRRDPDTGAHTNYTLAYLATPQGIAVGPDNALWFTQYQTGLIGRLTVDGQLSEAFTGDNLPLGITAGPDGAMWFVEQRPTNCNVVRLKLNGAIQRFVLPWYTSPNDIVDCQDDSLWFTMSARNRIGRIRYTTAGNVVLYGNLQDPGTRDRHWVIIDWGDGSAPNTLQLKPGILTFAVAHTYTGAGPSYPVNVTVTDDDAGVATASDTVNVTP